jgi:hypothetical protein
MNDYNKQAYAKVAEGEKKLKGSFFHNLMTSKEERIDNGIECYKQAIKYFKLAKNCKSNQTCKQPKSISDVLI